MSRCPKCGGATIIGPRYVYDSLRGERLQYRCFTCGYVRSEPTVDQGKAVSARLTPSEKGKALGSAEEGLSSSVSKDVTP